MSVTSFAPIYMYNRYNKYTIQSLGPMYESICSTSQQQQKSSINKNT